MPAVWRTVEEHLATAQVARVLYGAIIGLALIVTLEHHPPDPGVVAASLVATGLAVAFAEFYSDFIGTQTRLRHTVERHHVRHIVTDAAAVFIGIVFPAVFFVLAGFGWIESQTAFTAAKWSGLGLIGVLRVLRRATVGPLVPVRAAARARGHGDRRRADRLQGLRSLAASTVGASSASVAASTSSLARCVPPIRATASSKASAHTCATSTAATAAPGSSVAARSRISSAEGPPAASARSVARRRSSGSSLKVTQRRDDAAGAGAAQLDRGQLAGGRVLGHEQGVEHPQRAAGLEPLQRSEELTLERRATAEPVDQ